MCRAVVFKYYSGDYMTSLLWKYAWNGRPVPGEASGTWHSEPEEGEVWKYGGEEWPLRPVAEGVVTWGSSIGRLPWPNSVVPTVESAWEATMGRWPMPLEGVILQGVYDEMEAVQMLTAYSKEAKWNMVVLYDETST